MPELPKGMLRGDRPVDQNFDGAELLYRRVPPDSWKNGHDKITLDAIDLPDMSVLRSRYAHPEWARFHGDQYTYADWGIIGFAVQDIPPQFLDQGVFTYTFAPHHAPEKRNYPHTEVRSFENNVHISVRDRLSPSAHLRWRGLLLRRIQKVILPREERDVQSESPPPQN